jgi:agmatine/peptidylarginine deiminase
VTTLRDRVLSILELVLGIAPLTVFYLYLFPAGLFWSRQAVRASTNAYALGMVAAFVLGGLGILSLWLAVGGRLLGRAAGRLVVIGIFAGMAVAVFQLTTAILLGAFWTDYFLYGAPLLVAVHLIVVNGIPRGTARFTLPVALASGVIVLLVTLSGGAAEAPPAKASSEPVQDFTLDRPRVPAEWEPALGAMVAWPPIVPEALLVEIARDDTLFLLVNDDKARSEAEAAAKRLAIDRTHVRYIVAAAGDARDWPRDWGPFPLFDAAGAFHLADPRFLDYPVATLPCGAPLFSERALDLADFETDDRATEAVARGLGVSRLPLDYVLTGGNALVDGHGTAFSTCVLMDENRRSLHIEEADFRRREEKELGIGRHVVVPNFEWFGIQHIDCLMKPLDEETLLVKRLPENHPGHGIVESIAAALAATPGPYGRPYRIVRIDTPPYALGWFTANYTNSLVLNRKVLVPLFGIPADEAALETFRKEMPGYKVIGFRNPGREGWNWTDALHCRVRAVWDPGMLYMSHARVSDGVDPAAPIHIEALVRAYSGAGLDPSELEVFWRPRGETQWHGEPLVASGSRDGYAAELPASGSGRTVEYYLAAGDLSGRRQTLPRGAPEGFYSVRSASIK